MSEAEYQELIDRYDKVICLLENLRIIAYGRAMLIEDSCPVINRMLREQQCPQLRARFNDACSALIWLRDELMEFPMEENPPAVLSDSVKPSISL